jgi:hypothetical protein
MKKILKGIGILATILVCIFVLLAIYGYLTPATGTPERQDAVDETLKGYVELYMGFVNVTVLNKSLSQGVWMATVSARTLDRIIFMDMWMHDSNKSVFKIYESITPPSRPATIIDIPGKISCSTGNKKTVDIYIDPYDPWSQRYDYLIENFTAKFSSEVKPSYRLIPTSSFEAFKSADTDAVYAFRYMECAKETAEFSSLKKCIYETNAAKGGGFLNESEVQGCVSKAGLNVTSIENCSKEQALQLLAVDERFAESYLEQLTTPSVVVDCKYRTFPLFIDRVICYLYPMMKGC